MHPPDPLPARGAGEWAPRRRLVEYPGVPAGGDCELLQVLLRVNERVFRPAGGRDGLCGCFAIFIAPQMTAGYLLQSPDIAPAARRSGGSRRASHTITVQTLSDHDAYRTARYRSPGHRLIIINITNSVDKYRSVHTNHNQQYPPTQCHPHVWHPTTINQFTMRTPPHRRHSLHPQHQHWQ